MINARIRLIIFFAAEDGEALYSQQKQAWELTVALELLTAKFRLKLKKVGKINRPFCSVAQLCPTLCDPMDCSTPGFPVNHQLLEPIQTHVH